MLLIHVEQRGILEELRLDIDINLLITGKNGTGQVSSLALLLIVGSISLMAKGKKSTCQPFLGLMSTGISSRATDLQVIRTPIVDVGSEEEWEE